MEIVTLRNALAPLTHFIRDMPDLNAYTPNDIRWPRQCQRIDDGAPPALSRSPVIRRQPAPCQRPYCSDQRRRIWLGPTRRLQRVMADRRHIRHHRLFGRVYRRQNASNAYFQTELSRYPRRDAHEAMKWIAVNALAASILSVHFCTYDRLDGDGDFERPDSYTWQVSGHHAAR